MSQGLMGGLVHQVIRGSQVDQVQTVKMAKMELLGPLA